MKGVGVWEFRPARFPQVHAPCPSASQPRADRRHRSNSTVHLRQRPRRERLVRPLVIVERAAARLAIQETAREDYDRRLAGIDAHRDGGDALLFAIR